MAYDPEAMILLHELGLQHNSLICLSHMDYLDSRPIGVNILISRH